MKIRHNSRKYRVLKHLVEYGTITRDYAIRVFLVQNIADVICNLRFDHGLRIYTNKFNQENGLTVAVYELPYYERNKAQEALKRAI